MRKTIALLAAVSAITLTAPAAFAQNFGGNAGAWLSIDQRQANLEARINAGVQRGALTASEAAALRTEFRALQSLEAAYRATGGGIDANERRDLDSRFDALSARIRDQATDSDRGGGQQSGTWQTIAQRQSSLEAQIAAGLRNRTLAAAEARELRIRVSNLVALEIRYQAGGLSTAERRELDVRFDNLQAMIRERASDQNSGSGPIVVQPVPGWSGGGWVINGRWQNVYERKAELDRRIDYGQQIGRISRQEAASLRADYNAIAQLEISYRRGGLSLAERNELDRRFDQLAARIRIEAWDNNNGRGPGGRGPRG